MKNIILMLLFLTTIAFGQSQKSSNLTSSSGKIYGYLFDELTNKPIEYGNIAVFSAKDSSLITGSISSKNGYFEIDNIKPGQYFCNASFMGYETFIAKNVVVDKNNKLINLGNITLKAKSISLNQVNVTAEKNIYSYNIEKKVVNVDKMLTAAGGSALDILQNVPSVNVDADGTVTLRGNSNLTLLIDGKPNGMAALSPEDALAQIPASTIESVEIVTNPSAKYDPSGTGGIINIILKKNVDTGFNGVLTTNVGTKDKYDGSLSLNYRVNGINLFANINGRSGYNEDVNSSERLSDTGSLLEQNQLGTSTRLGKSINTGIDYYLNDFNTLSLGFRVRNFGGNSVSDLYNNQYDNTLTSLSGFDRNSNSDRDMTSYNYSFGYKKTFDEKYRELTLDVSYSDNKMNANSFFIQDNNIGGVLTEKQNKSISNNKNKEWEIEGNYIHPISKTSKLEVGFASNIENPIMHFNYYTNTVNGLVEDMLKRNYFDYELQTHAVYATYTDQILGVSYQAGLRAEKAYTDATSELTGISYKNDYFSLYPSIHLSYQINQSNELNLSYSRRVDRPSHRQLNPYVDYTDSLNISYGNPYLKPQYINSVELSYGLYIGKASYTASVFGKQTNDVITSTSILGDDGITRTSYENIAKSYSYGMEFIAMQNLLSWWKINANVSVYKYQFENNGADVSTYDNYSWTAKLNNNFNLMWDVQMQLMLNYSSPSVAVRSGWGGSSVNSQTKMDAIYFADIALKKEFLDGKLSVLFKVSDLFATRNFSSTVTGYNFVTESTRANNSRTYYLGLTYKLNIGNIKERKKEMMNVDMDDF